MLTRRQFLQYGAVSGVAIAVPVRFATAARQVSTTVLDPTSIPKYASQLRVLPAMPMTRKLSGFDYYELAARQFLQQILPAGFPATTVWGYGSTSSPGAFSAPSFTIEAQVGRPVRVKWANGLVDRSGKFLPHPLTVDPTLHWANPPGGKSGRDMRPSFTSTPPPYRGPVPLVTHLHGAHSDDFSDGYSEAWYLPAASNIPRGFAVEGTYYDQFMNAFHDAFGQPWDAGSATFQYGNDQRATTLFFHDHSLGLTRVNVYMGLAGMYLLRGGSDDLPKGVLPGGPQEIALAIQDRTFNDDGSLHYPASRVDFDGFTGPYIGNGNSDISPYWNPETFGNTILVNGRTWPTVKVEARRYRFRIVNNCQTRALLLTIASRPQPSRPTQAALPFWQIGADGGFLPAPVQTGALLMGGAERVDVVVDFSGVRPGTKLYLVNQGPDEPFGGGDPDADFAPADPATTGQVLRFEVVKAMSDDHSVPPSQLRLPSFNGVGRSQRTRRLSLNEDDSATLDGIGPRAGLLGIVDASGHPVEKMWMDDVTENLRKGQTETWELYNFTEDAHPIHVHLVQFQVVNRQALATDADGMPVHPVQPVGPTIPPEPGETGTKDTLLAYPGQVTRFKATFDKAGRYVWHCHIIEHEDNEMMRPFVVT